MTDYPLLEYPSLGRQGLDKLLALNEAHEVLLIRSIRPTSEHFATSEPFTPEPWITVDLLSPSQKIERWAIWRNTGNVYAVDELGAAADDPTIVVTPLEGGL